MAIYNTEEYLREAVDSIINQTIGFEENVQLVLVNDGSPDACEEIILDYQKRFPDNVVAISKENGGQASARNLGLKYVDAKYVNFLDSDDYLAENALEEVYPFFEKYQDKTDIVAIPITFFERKEEPHMLNNKFEESRVIDLSKDNNNPQLSSSSAFFRMDVACKYEFPTNVLFSEDVIFINKILLDNPFLGVINTTEYFYRKRFDESSTIDIVNKEKEFFIDRLRDYFLYLFEYAELKLGKVPYFLQYTLAYDLQWVFHEDLSLLDESEVKEFWSYLRRVLDYIDVDIIIYNRYIRNTLAKQFFLAMKKEEFHIEPLNDNLFFKIGEYDCGDLANQNLWLDIVDLRDGVLTISGFLNSLADSKSISFEAIKCQNGAVVDKYLAKQVKYTSRENVEFLSHPFKFFTNFDITIPVEENETSQIKLRLNYHRDDNNQNFDSENVVHSYLDVQFAAHAKLSRFSNYKIDGSNMLFFKDNTFFLVPKSAGRFIKRELSNIFHIALGIRNIPKGRIPSFIQVIMLRSIYFVTYPFFKIYLRNKEIYLFEDRIDVADDNAFHLFKYANTVNDNVKKYFVLSKESKQYKMVSKVGSVLVHHSLKHKFVMFYTDKIISSHPYETVINPFWSYHKNKRDLVAGLLNYKIYFLQHGVTKDNISSWMSKFDKNLSLIVTVSDEETKSFYEEGYGYDKSIIQNLGFPRFDNLEKNDSKQILIIPTWRKTLRGDKRLFMNSDYFKSISSLLNNEKLVEMIEKGYKVIFRPHPELFNHIQGKDSERYIELFDIPSQITVSQHESYQELFNNSSVLVTDYSSVFFDFAYLKKPVVYYHPADDYHYEKSYFKYDTMGFGAVVKSENELIEKLFEYIANNCEMEDEYKKRVDDFFTYTDQNNCQRVYDWIKKH